mmetsp:Transcript_628/g.2428  ORF Transcript_628/g.2428 Transcript_628/m.2428 type:complete len:282 (+) Transcript_628:551-1396(+)
MRGPSPAVIYHMAMRVDHSHPGQRRQRSARPDTHHLTIQRECVGKASFRTDGRWWTHLHPEEPAPEGSVALAHPRDAPVQGQNATSRLFVCAQAYLSRWPRCLVPYSTTSALNGRDGLHSGCGELVGSQLIQLAAELQHQRQRTLEARAQRHARGLAHPLLLPRALSTSRAVSVLRCVAPSFRARTSLRHADEARALVCRSRCGEPVGKVIVPVAAVARHAPRDRLSGAQLQRKAQRTRRPRCGVWDGPVSYCRRQRPQRVPAVAQDGERHVRRVAHKNQP